MGGSSVLEGRVVSAVCAARAGRWAAGTAARPVGSSDGVRDGAWARSDRCSGERGVGWFGVGLGLCCESVAGLVSGLVAGLDSDSGLRLGLGGEGWGWSRSGFWACLRRAMAALRAVSAAGGDLM